MKTPAMFRHVMAAAVVLSLASSCKKESIPEPSKNSSAKNGALEMMTAGDWLSFETVDEFEITGADLTDLDTLALDAWEESHDFTSLRRTENNVLEELPGEDLVLSTMLNPDGLVQVANYLFAVDRVNEEVRVLEESHHTPDLIVDLINRTASEHILTFPFKEDVFEHLQLRIFCNETNRSNASNFWYTPHFTSNGITYRVRFGAAYTNIGIWSTLKTRTTLYYWASGGWWPAPSSIKPAGYIVQFTPITTARKPKCKSCESSYDIAFYTSHDIQKTYHTSTTGLHYYRVHGSVKAKTNQTGWVTTPVINFQSWFGGTNPPCN